MATDFFEREDHARRQTRRLVAMFVMAVAVIVLAIYLVVAMVAIDVLQQHGRVGVAPTLWDPALFACVALGTILVISAGSLYKISELSAGGEHVALMLGGRAVNPQTQDLAERRLLNVVEEMALASGIPVPPVYVLDREPGINAFAAGHRPGNAVVAVSAGCLHYLNREELQGVMGHEFSHILNGDMRLNLRLIGIVFGIVVLSVCGYYVMRSASLFSSRDSKGRGAGAAAAVLFLGLALWILGCLGVLLGKLIKSAVSRQREFLADASSVQFTRAPGGITGALKKIGGLAEGSRIRDAHAEEISHMFFGDAFAGSFFNLFATHPPLGERIRAFDPGFDGRFPPIQAETVVAEIADQPGKKGTVPICRNGPEGASHKWGPGTPWVPFSPQQCVDQGDLVQRIGRPQASDSHHAGQVLRAMPAVLLDSAREPSTARAVIYALLLSRDDEATRTLQLQMLQSQLDPHLYQETQQLAAVAQPLDAGARLPLVDLAVPALKKASPEQYAQFRQVVEALVGAEHKVDLFEYCLRTVLFSYLDVYFRLKKPPAIRYRTVGAVAQPAAVVLSTLANVGARSPEDVQRAFQAGAEELGQFVPGTLGAGAQGLGPLAIVPRQQCSLRTFDAAVAELAKAGPYVKRAVISAASACIAADGKVTIEENELLRVLAAVLACPVPPSPPLS